MRRTMMSVAVTALTAMVIGLGGAPASAVTATRNGHLAYNVVQLGDSYSAGNGAGAYYGDPAARRSHNSYAEKYTEWLATQPDMHVRYTSFAHSGHTTAEVLRDQIPQVPTDTDLVLLTIGGNDVKFQDIVRYCFVVGSRSSSDCRSKVDAARSALPDVRTKTEAILQALSDRLGPDAEIILVGYPRLSTSPEFSLCDYTFLCWGSYSYNASAGVRDLGAAANAMQAALVSDWNRRPGAARVFFAAGVTGAFEGREPEPRVGYTNPRRWVNEFWETEGVQNPVGATTSASFSSDSLNWYHPNTTGHAQIAAVLSRDIGLTPSARHVQAVNRNRSMALAAPPAANAGAEDIGDAGPDAWLHGPWVQQVGTPITLDARGSLAGGSEIVGYEWDVDADPEFDAVTAEPTYTHEFAALFDGQVTVRVTQADGRTATASTRVQITEDGDSAPAGVDNCPDLDNDSQSDADRDGIGDECDLEPGHPREDRPGVHAVDAAGELSREGVDTADATAVPENSAGASVMSWSDGARVGGTLRISASGFVPGDTLQVWLHSAPVLLGSATVAADGTAALSADIPSSVQAGAHRLYAVAPAMLASMPLDVAPAAEVGAGSEPGSQTQAGSRAGDARAGSASPTDSSGRSSLAATGSAPASWLLPAGAIVVLAGAGLRLVVARRRADLEHCAVTLRRACENGR